MFSICGRLPATALPALDGSRADLLSALLHSACNSATVSTPAQMGPIDYQ